VTKLKVCQCLAALVSSKTPHKVRERAVVALGRLPVGDAGFPHTKLVLESLLQSSEVRVWKWLIVAPFGYTTLPHPSCPQLLAMLIPKCIHTRVIPTHAANSANDLQFITVPLQSSSNFILFRMPSRNNSLTLVKSRSHM